MGRFNSIEKTLSASQLILDGLLADPQLIKATAPFGYDRTRIRKAKAQLEHTRMLGDSKNNFYLEKKRATQHFNHARKELRQKYLQHSGVLRAFYRTDTVLLDELGLN